jgi:PAS domain S-box-containing protein
MPGTGKNNDHTERISPRNRKPTKVEPLFTQSRQSDELRSSAEKIAKDRIAKHDKKPAEDASRLIHDLEVHQIELEMQNEELHRTHKELEDSRNKYSNLYHLAPVGYFTLDKNTCIVEVNLTGCQMLGTKRASLINKSFCLYVSEDCQDRFYLHRRQVLETNTRQSCEISLLTKDGRKLEVLLESVSAADAEGNNSLCQTTVIDITESKLTDEHEATIKMLSLINSQNQTHELMKLVTVFLRDWSGCESVGIRLQEGEDFPYFETSGFSDEFLKIENKLCSLNELGEPIRDSHGRVFLECMCGNIISGRFDSTKPFFTKHGSFWTNSTTALLAGTSSADRLAKTRNYCNTVGYESVALIPLRTGKETFGLLQFNSKQKNQFTPEKISLFERLADNLAIGLAQRKAEEALRKSEARYRHLFGNMLDGFAYCRMLFEHGRPQDFIYLDVNESFEKLTGLKNVVGHRVTEVIPGIKESNPEMFEIYGRVALTGQAEKFETYLSSLKIWFSVSVYSPQKECFAAVFENVTERKQAEEELLWKTALLESQVEANLDGVLVVDGNNQIILTNKRLIELFKVSQQVVENKDDASLLKYVVSQAKYPEQFLEKVKYLYSHQDQTSRDELEFKNGMVFDRYSSPVVDKDGKYLGRIWTFRDITDQKRAEVELKKHLDELVSWQNVTIGRESRVMELKKEVNELLAKLGQPPRYENQDT